MSTAASANTPTPVKPHQVSVRAADAGEVVVAELEAAGTTEVVVNGSVRVDADGRSLTFLRFLREASSAGIRVTWAAESLSDTHVALLTHLPPPVDSAAGAAEQAARWQAEHRYGSCYYRRGPGFVTVKDTRVATTPIRFVIDDELAVVSFGKLLDVANLNEAGPSVRDLAEILAHERLVLRFGNTATLLPVRMRRWPVPYDAI